MDFVCDVCDKFIKPKSKFKDFESNIQKEFHIYKPMELNFKNRNINSSDEVFFAYIIQHNKQYDQCRIKSHFKLVSNDNQFVTWIKSNLFNNKTKMSWKKYL